MNDIDIPVPRNVEAEKALLGACIQHGGSLAEARRYVRDDDFWSTAHEVIWRHLCAMADNGDPIAAPADRAVALFSSLTKTNELDATGGANYLHDLVSNPFGGTNVGYSASLVHEAARARRALQISTRITQVIGENQHDHEQMLQLLARQVIDLEVLVDERTGESPIQGLSTWDEFFAKPRDPHHWLVPDFLHKQDVMMILGGEGGGKSYLTRQICMCASAGIHPFHFNRYIAPRVTLHIDLENPDDLVAEEGHGIRTQVRQLGGWVPANAHIWHRPQGLNLRERKDALLLERAVAETGAEIVTLGSLYKSFSRKGDSWDQAAEESREVFDRIRARYGCAFILEHHMPKGDGGHDRPQTPFGSQQWMGWASMGYAIQRVGDNMWRLNQFRGNRGERHIPLGLTRGGELPWTPVWDEETINYGMWEELRKRQTHR